MGIFNNETQKELDALATRIFESMGEIGHYMDHFGARLDEGLRYRLQNFENNIQRFCVLCQQNQSTISHVKWQGKSTLIMGVLSMISAVLEDIRINTGYAFNKLT